MPTVIVPTTPALPYDSVGYVLNLARVYINDATNDITGDLLASDQPYTVVLLNSAFRTLQDRLIDAGVESLIKELILLSIPAATATDPSVNTFLTWDGFWNGTEKLETPSLPFDLVIPAKLWERHSGVAESFVPMNPVDGGIEDCAPQDRLGVYEWRDDKIWFRGASSVNDLKLRYVAYYPELSLTDETTPVPIMRSAQALAYMMAEEFTRARGGSTADNFHALAEQKIGAMTLRTTRRKQEVSYRRKRYS